jgi:hypothetical protein
VAEESWPDRPAESESFWLEQAAKVRADAKLMTTPETRHAMETIARSYESLARYVRNRTDRRQKEE